MTEEDPTPKMAMASEESVAELRKLIAEQQQVMVKQNELLKDMQTRMSEYEKVQSAVPAAAPAAQPKESAQDIAYKAMLKEWGVKED